MLLALDKAQLPSITDCWTYVTLSDSCLAKCSALVADGRSRRYGWILERPRSEDEKKLQSGSTSSSASGGVIGAIFHETICESASRTSKRLWHCEYIAAICVTVGPASVVETQLRGACVWTRLDLWPALLQSYALQIRVALLSGKKNDLYNRAYDRKGGPDKSATRIPNLQAQSPKDFFLGGIASCSVQLLLRVVNVQAIHEYQLVHAQGHVHDALDSSPQYRMQLHDLMLYSSLRAFQYAIWNLRRKWAAPPPFRGTLVQGRSISSSSRDSSFVDHVLQKKVSGWPHSEGPWLQAFQRINGRQVAGAIYSFRIP